MKHGLILVCLVLLPGAAAACSQSFPEFPRGRDFSVRINMNGVPVRNMRVLIEPEGEQEAANQTLVGLTDSGGVAQFKKVKPGRYYVEAIRLGVVVGPGTVIVSKHGSSEEIVVDWPFRPTYDVATIEGRFQTQLFPKGNPMEGYIHPRIGPLAQAKLTLSRVDSEQQVSVITTDEDGRFQFPVLESGYYLLHLLGGRIDDDILIKVDPTSARRDLRLRVYWSSCGISTSDIDRSQ